jgi:hypothetical protein
LNALFDYLISRPNAAFNINTLPNLGDKALWKICDQVMNENSIPRYKFDSIVQILMKKKEAERLINLARNACYDQYKIECEGKNGLSLEDKLNLVYTSSIVLEGQRTKFT